MRTLPAEFEGVISGRLTAVIPSYRPDGKLPETVAGLADAGFDDIMIVDDGSGAGYDEIFAACEACPAVTLLRHGENLGKGAATKTAFAYFLEHRAGRDGVVTLDGTGRHLPDDAAACGARMLSEGGKVVIGIRDFAAKGAGVPFGIRIARFITSLMVKLSCGCYVSDTQSGLRAIPAAALPLLAAAEGERYEYGTNMLMAAAAAGIGIAGQKITAVYRGTGKPHFRPIPDTFRIYAQILKFSASSFISYSFDLLAFYLLQKFLAPHIGGASLRLDVVICTVIARVLSCTLNFTLNRNAVFRSKDRLAKTVFKYIAVAVPIMLTSGGLVTLLRRLFGASYPSVVTAIKLLVDTCLYFANYRMQRRWVFAGKKQTITDNNKGKAPGEGL